MEKKKKKIQDESWLNDLYVSVYYIIPASCCK